jgi:hypothetical protein
MRKPKRPETASEAESAGELHVGDRVECRWGRGSTYYPGYIDEIEGGRVRVCYDDGAEEWTSPARCRPLPEATAAEAPSLAVGDRVECRWGGGDMYYGGQVTDVRGGRVRVAYDDGAREWTSAAHCRKVRIWKAGDRALAAFKHDIYWYPATVRKVEGERCYVAFDNGDKQWTAPDGLLELDVEAGDRVHCRHGSGDEYRAGRVSRCEAEKLLVHFEDGSEEWAEIGRCRVTR